MNALSTMFGAVSDLDDGNLQTYEAEGSMITLHRLQKSDLIVISKEPLPKGLIDKFTKSHLMIEQELENNYFDNDQGVDIPPEERLDKIFERAQIPFVYLWPYAVNKNQVSEVYNLPRADDKSKFYLNLITEFNLEYIDEGPFQLRKLSGFLGDRKLFRREITRCIDFYISYGIIKRKELRN